MPGKRIIKENPRFATQPGIAATQDERNDRRSSLSSTTASPATASPRHGVVSPAQQAHDTSKLIRDLQARVVKVEAEVVELKDEKKRLGEELNQEKKEGAEKDKEMKKHDMSTRDLLARVANVEAEVAGLKEGNGRLEEELSEEKKEGVKRDKEMEKLRKRSVMAEETERNVGAKEAIKAVVHEVEQNELKNGVKEAMETMKAETRDMKRAAAEVMNRLEEERRREPRKEETGVKMVVEEGEEITVAERREGRKEINVEKRVVILTDSNGATLGEDAIKNHIPEERRAEFRVEVVVCYTLEEALHRIERGNVDVEGAVVIIDNITNDVRGTRTRPQTSPEEVAERLRSLVWLMRSKAQAVVICEVKPMYHINVNPYNLAIHHKFLDHSKVFGCRTMTRLGHLKTDGFHIGAAYVSVLERTYACALMGIVVPYPTRPDQFWRPEQQQQHLKRLEQEWPRVGESRNLNVWRRREEKRRTMTQIP
jgi:hypothetical protein